jgi:hypothetical protein
MSLRYLGRHTTCSDLKYSWVFSVLPVNAKMIPIPQIATKLIEGLHFDYKF